MVCALGSGMATDKLRSAGRRDVGAERQHTPKLPLAKAPRECSHRPPCPGCPHFGAVGLAEGTERRLRAWCEKMGVADLQVVAGQSHGYRHRVRLAVRGRASNPKLGLFEAGSHQVVDIPQCLIHHPRINQVAGWLKQHLRRAKVSTYSEAHHAGLVRYAQLALERETGTVQVVVVGNSERIEPLTSLFEALRRDPHPHLHSLVFNGHPERSNAVFGPHWAVHSGPATLVDVIGEARVHYPPGAFSQANPALFEGLVSEIHAWVEPGGHLVELYCGVGAIGLGLVRQARHVVFNEIAAQSLTGLELGLGELERVHSTLPPVAVVPGLADAALPWVTRESQVIVDPPRKGLEPAVLAGLIERRPRRLIYVSCGFGAFERDAEALVSAGFGLRRVRGYALFPFTDHVETLAEFVLD